MAIVNRRFAEHFFPGKSAVGKRLGWGGGPKSKLTIEIIGVVADSLYEGPREGVRRQVFVPNWGKGGAVFYVRTQTGSAAAASLMRNEVKQLDASMPVYEMKTVEGQLDETLLTDRLIALLSAGFGLLATLLASIGLYGVMAFVVARRRKELGIRLALGSPRGVVIWLVMSEVLMLLAIGLAIGIPAAMASGSFVSSQLYGIAGARSLDRGFHGRAADAGLGRGGTDPGPPRQPDRSDPGAAPRVTQGQAGWSTRYRNYRPGRSIARRGHAAQRSHLHLAIDERPGHAHAAADVIRQRHRVRRVHDLDRRRALLQEARLPAARLRCTRAGGVLEAERVVVLHETAGERHRRCLCHDRG